MLMGYLEAGGPFSLVHLCLMISVSTITRWTLTDLRVHIDAGFDDIVPASCLAALIGLISHHCRVIVVWIALTRETLDSPVSFD